MSDDTPSGGAPREEGSSGHAMARKALEDAREAARAAGKSVGQGRASPNRRRATLRRSRGGWSGAGPDARDPQPLGRLTGALSRDRGWGEKIGEGTVFGAWDRIVGPEISAHAQPTDLRDKMLFVTAESTAWATQLRLIQGQIIAKIAVPAVRERLTEAIERELAITEARDS